MRRTFWLFGAGVLLGAVAMYFAHGDGEEPGTAASDTGPFATLETAASGKRAPSPIDFLTLATGSVSVSEHAALLRLAAEADRRTLETLAEQVAALPNLEGRRLALEALFTRYAEIDGPAAAAFARTLDLPAEALTPVFVTWTRADARGALQALGHLDGPAAITLGVALLDILGNDDLGIARVLGAAPQIDADRFRIEAAVAKATADPAGALEDVLLLPPTKASAGLERIAVIFSQADVHGALAGAERIGDDNLRNEFRRAVMRAWARTDPDALVDYVLDLGADERNEALRSGALQAFALIDPERALRAAESVSGEVAQMIRRSALMSLSRDDPLAAIGMVDTLPAGEREQMLTMIATNYGRADPDAALAWAQSLSPPSPSAVANVLAGLARVDPDRAMALAFEMPADEQRRMLTSLVMNGALEAAKTAAIADRLLAAPNRRQELQMLTQMWAQREPHDALRWLLARGDQAPQTAIAHAGMRLARTDPAAAIGYLGNIPYEMRARWISSVAAGYAETDPRGAAIWIAQHRGEAGYEAAVAAIASRTAPQDPLTAARLFDSIDLAAAPDAPQTALAIASAWARQDPRAAAAWALAVGKEDVSAAAVGAATMQWAGRDAAAARGWALGLREGAARDAALTQIVGVTTTASNVDHAIVEAYSSAEARQRGVNDAVRMVAQRDPAGARQLADQYLTDPGMRLAAERFIEQGRSGPLVGQRPPRLPQER